MNKAGHKVAESRNLLLLLAAGAAIMATPAEQYWWLGPSLAGIAAILVVWFNWGQHQFRRLKMKSPYRVELVGPDGMVQELHAKANSEVSVQLRIWPHLSYQHHEIVFGFIGDQTTKPVPLKTINEFIKIGLRREQSPETNENHAIDMSDNYHIREDRHVSLPNNYSYGFVVKTRATGVFPIRFELITDGGESCPHNSLYLTVD